MPIRFGMTVFYVRDLERAAAFYRLLGVDLPEPLTGRPVIRHELAPGVTLLLTTDDVARRLDPAWRRPEGGYQQVIEFFVDDDGAVDELWDRMTAAGHVGRTAPATCSARTRRWSRTPTGTWC